MARGFRQIACLTLVVSTLAATAHAQTPIDPLDARDGRRLDRMEKVVRELRSIVFKGRDTGVPVVVQPAETDGRIQEVSDKVSDLQKSLTQLNGQIESLAFDLAKARSETQALKAEKSALEARVYSLEHPPVPEPVAIPVPLSAAEVMTQGRQRLAAGDNAGAAESFEDYIVRFADDPKAVEAHYGLGKARIGEGKWSEGATALIGAIRGWPQTSWAPDAITELSRALIQLKKPADACRILGELSQRYPKAPATIQTRAAALQKQAKCTP